jgi:L-alanine-DL-glutamate epimerase-like enolase superfamily enzyme
LADLGVQFIEQPLPVGALPSDKRKLYARSALPIIADEDCQIASDVQGCHGKYHGVNIKICKCGGLSPALKMLRDARRLGMKTMVGCMVESSIGISGAAQLLPLLDFADLDGANLLCDQPASGVQITQGMIARPETPGCGASLNWARLQEFALNH